MASKKVEIYLLIGVLIFELFNVVMYASFEQTLSIVGVLIILIIGYILNYKIKEIVKNTEAKENVNISK